MSILLVRKFHLILTLILNMNEQIGQYILFCGGFKNIRRRIVLITIISAGLNAAMFLLFVIMAQKLKIHNKTKKSCKKLGYLYNLQYGQKICTN